MKLISFSCVRNGLFNLKIYSKCSSVPTMSLYNVYDRCL